MTALETAADDCMNVDWRAGLPDLPGGRVTLRELRREDATSLQASLSRPEVMRFTWPPPASVAGFERFIEWAHGERRAGKYICYGIVPHGHESPCGVFELRQLQPGFFRGELGFVLDPAAWSTGIFSEGAQLLLRFAFEVVKVHRIEARTAVANTRGNAALKKIGAHHEGVLRAAFVCDGQFVDQNLWAILADSSLVRSEAPRGHARH